MVVVLRVCFDCKIAEKVSVLNLLVQHNRGSP